MRSRPTPLISLVITTYNRAALLREALASVAAAVVEDDDSVEVLVIDNNSSDDTAATVEEIRRAGYRFALSYALEVRQGTSYARNRGIALARGHYIAFMDDDQRIDRHYLANVPRAFVDTGAACVGGPVRYYNYDVSDIPQWLAPIVKYIGQLDCGDAPMVIGEGTKRLAGGNMVFTRDALGASGGFDIRLGHHGARLGGNEDWEIQDRLIAGGKVVAYHPALVQYHYLRPERFDKRYWRRLYFSYGRSLYLRGDWHGARLSFGAPRFLWRALIAKDCTAWAASWFSFDYPTIFLRQLAVWQRLGKIAAARAENRRPLNAAPPERVRRLPGGD